MQRGCTTVHQGDTGGVLLDAWFCWIKRRKTANGWVFKNRYGSISAGPAHRALIELTGRRSLLFMLATQLHYGPRFHTFAAPKYTCGRLSLPSNRSKSATTAGSKAESTHGVMSLPVAGQAVSRHRSCH